MTLTVEPPAPEQAPARAPRKRKRKRQTSHFAHGEPHVWLTGGALVVALAMIAGLLLVVLWQGLGTFWPGPISRFEVADGRTVVGEVTRAETLETDEGPRERLLVRSGNYQVTNTRSQWVDADQITGSSTPEWSVVFERLSWGRFYGTPVAFVVDGEDVATEPAEVWALYEQNHAECRDRYHESKELETDDIGADARQLEGARLAIREAELAEGEDSEAAREAREAYDRAKATSDVNYQRIMGQIGELRAENQRYGIRMEMSDGAEKTISLADVVRGYPANRISFGKKVSIYFARWWEFLSEDPRYMNTEGGVLPAIFGTVAMTMLMSLVVVPFGVLAALYLREYAKQGVLVSMVRVAMNNLAGVPSIVFGAFGLGFFCYVVGVGIDEWYLPFAAKLPTPTLGTGGLLWASLTLALLTLPVVIVATEEALAAVPSSMREGSYACGASKWQTIRRIVLPRAAPGIMTGMILAIARGAGEVAPLMLVGAVKMAPKLPVDGVFPYLHPERTFMHLGFHIYDLGFQSPDSEAAKPMVFTTTLLLIGVVVLLNLLAIWVRARLRQRFQAVHI